MHEAGENFEGMVLIMNAIKRNPKGSLPMSKLTYIALADFSIFHSSFKSHSACNMNNLTNRNFQKTMAVKSNVFYVFF